MSTVSTGLPEGASQAAGEHPWVPYTYVVLRAVPRVDREEFVNVGVVLFCQDDKFLGIADHVDPDKVCALDPQVDLDTLQATLDTYRAVCAGDAVAGLAADARQWRRFGWLSAPRSAVLQPGPTHSGQTKDPAAELQRLATRLVH